MNSARLLESIFLLVVLGVLFSFLGNVIADALWERGPWIATVVTLLYAAFAGVLLGTFVVWWYFE